MPKSTLVIFQSGLFYSKKLVKVTDKQKSDSDASLTSKSLDFKISL